MRKVLEIGGIVAAAVLIAFGIASIVMASNGRTRSARTSRPEQITGTPDMASTRRRSPARWPGSRPARTRCCRSSRRLASRSHRRPSTIPGCSVAGNRSPTVSSARCFAQYMFIHAMGATSGLVYSQMGRYMAKPDTPFKYTDGEGGLSPAHRRDRRQVRPGRREDPAAGRPTARGTSGSTRRPVDGAQRELHGRSDLAVRARRRHRPAALGNRIRHPRRRRCAPESAAACSASLTRRQDDRWFRPPRRSAPPSGMEAASRRPSCVRGYSSSRPWASA